jgi:hypothetical protein
MNDCIKIIGYRGKENLWLPPMEAFVKLDVHAVINLSREISEALTRQL